MKQHKNAKRLMKKRYRPTKHQKRMFRGMPVMEARASIHVQPNATDISGATKEDPQNCAYARCLKRTLDAPNVFVFASTAYIQTLSEKGAPIVERYIVRKYAREYIVRFDGGERVEPGGFVFHAPSVSKTLAYKHKQGLNRTRVYRPTVSRKPKPKAFSLRRGTGRVHLFGSADQIRVPANA